MTSIKDTIQMALISILDNKLRYILTLIGIVVGISSVIAIVSLGNGAGDTIKDNFISGDENKREININYQPSVNRSDETKKAFSESNLKFIGRIKGVKSIKGDYSEFSQVAKDDKNLFIEIKNKDKDENLKESDLIYGRTFNEKELEKPSRICIVGEELAKFLFESSDKAIGKTTDIGGKPMRIIGVKKEEGMFSLVGGTSSILITTPTWDLAYGDGVPSSLKVEIAEGYDLMEMSENVINKLNDDSDLQGKYKAGDSMKEMAKGIDSFTTIFTTFISCVAGISLVVGGIGIMNIMYVAITERTREIGIRRALGATSKKILFQFLVESVVICLIGGIIGVSLGIGLAKIIAPIIKIRARVSLNIIFIGIGVSSFMGIVFGISPAIKASKLNTVDALSYE